MRRVIARVDKALVDKYAPGTADAADKSAPPPSTPECSIGQIYSKQYQVAVSTLKNCCLVGELTFGDPFQHPGVAGDNPAANRWFL